MGAIYGDDRTHIARVREAAQWLRRYPGYTFLWTDWNEALRELADAVAEGPRRHELYQQDLERRHGDRDEPDESPAKGWESV